MNSRVLHRQRRIQFALILVFARTGEVKMIRIIVISIMVFGAACSMTSGKAGTSAKVGDSAPSEYQSHQEKPNPNIAKMRLADIKASLKNIDDTLTGDMTVGKLKAVKRSLDKIDKLYPEALFNDPDATRAYDEAIANAKQQYEEQRQPFEGQLDE
ncbi:MAG: hypothetical protein SFX73_05440 [Kofleriaceae bacterium]|nr:hypothetical protein [Kofleriaceae bacterium]